LERLTNLKKLFPIVLTLLLVSSCGSAQNQEEVDTFKGLLDVLADKGYSFDGKIQYYRDYTDGDDTTAERYLSIRANNEEYSVRKWAQSASNEEATKDSEDYTSRIYYHVVYSDGQKLIASDHLAISNEVETSFMTDINTGELATWDGSYFANCFALLSEDDFTKRGESDTYDLKIGEESLVDAYIALSRQLYGKAALEISSLTILKDDSGWNFTINYKPEDLRGYGEGYTSVSGTFIDPLNDPEIDRINPLDGEEDTTFVSKIGQLAGLNFRSETTYERESDVKSYVVEMNEDEFRFTYSDKIGTNDAKTIDDYAYIKSGEGKIQGVTNIAGSYYVDRDPIDGDVTDFSPTFKISSLFFDKDQDSGDYVFDMSSPLRDISIEDFSFFALDENISSLKIHFYPKSVQFKIYTVSLRNITISFSDFGAIEDEVTSLNTDCSALRWSDLLSKDPQSLSEASSDTYLKDSEILDSIPTVGGKYSNVYIENESLTYYAEDEEGNVSTYVRNYVELSIETTSDEEAESIRDEYKDKLISLKNWEIDLSIEAIEGRYYLKNTVPVLGGEYQLNLLLWNYSGLFDTHTFYIYAYLTALN
jgi:hypothetical protein